MQRRRRPLHKETPSWRRVVATTRDYYDSDDADNFYSRVWGGEDIHIGIYHAGEEPIAEASQRTVEAMAEYAGSLGPQTRVLDIGAGYGGSARFLARRFGCSVTCLNLSVKQNERNRGLSVEQGLAEQIRVVDGSFEEIPAAENDYDLVWSQDAILHSARRERVLAEVQRVLRPGGQMIFTDPMQSDNCPSGRLAAVLARIHLSSLGSPGFYWEAGARAGFVEFDFQNHSRHLVRHYQRVRSELSARRGELEEHVSQAYIGKMIEGLSAWVEAGEQGYLVWGLMRLRKPGS